MGEPCGMPRRWRTSARHPIPDEWRTVGPRFTRVYATGSRNASHPVNAILNYAYAVLQSQVQIKAVADGYDPMLGIMHYDRDGAPAFVFDMMEPDRPKVDRAVLSFLKSEALHPADFTIREDGVVRLNPEFARRVAGRAAIDACMNLASSPKSLAPHSGCCGGKPNLHAHFMAFGPGALAMEFTTLVMTSRLFALKPNPTRRGDRANSGRRCSI
jgi:hypothetical protein